MATLTDNMGQDKLLPSCFIAATAAGMVTVVTAVAGAVASAAAWGL